MGLDSRHETPELTRAVVYLASEIRSFDRAESATEKVLGQKVSQSTIRRLVLQVGEELTQLQEQDQRFDGKEVVVPEIAVVAAAFGLARQGAAGVCGCPARAVGGKPRTRRFVRR